MDLMSDRRPVRQRLRLRLSKQLVVVVAHHAAAERSPSADRVRAALRRRGQHGRSARPRSKAAASLLDSVAEEVTRLNNKLGPADRAKVGQYLETIREVERRIQQAEADAADNPLPDLDRPRRRAGFVRRSCAADVRFAAAGVPRRHHAGHHVPIGPRNQHPHVSGNRRAAIRTIRSRTTATIRRKSRKMAKINNSMCRCSPSS